MKSLKLISGGLVLIIISMFFWQNLSAFNTAVGFQFDLYVRNASIWTLKVYTLLILAVLFGFCSGILLMLKPYFKVRRSLAQEREDKHRDISTPVAPQASAFQAN